MADIDNELMLFKCADGTVLTAGDFRRALKKVKADECKVLFLHTEMSFGAMNRELSRQQLYETLVSLIEELSVGTVVYPTFTFSYGNKEDFDVRTTPTKMGVLNEYARKRPDAVRSVDPIMSVVVFGKNKDILNITGEKALGEGSIFDNLHHTEGVKFLFLGTRLGQCGTHMHYVEEQLRVPYRYDMEFTGKITGYDGVPKDDKRIIYVKYRDVIPCVPSSFEDMLVQSGKMLYVPMGNSGVYTITEEDMYDSISEALTNDVNAFLGEPYDTHPLVKDYHFGNVRTVQ